MDHHSLLTCVELCITLIAPQLKYIIYDQLFANFHLIPNTVTTICIIFFLVYRIILLSWPHIQAYSGIMYTQLDLDCLTQIF